MSELPMIRSLPGYPWLPEAEAARRDKARIAALEAEVARQAKEIEFLNDVGDERHAEKVKLEAERDRLKAALTQITEVRAHNTDVMFVRAWEIARAALSGDGVNT